MVPTYSEEAALLADGYSLIAGLDEAGRGPLAGPVVAGVVILPPDPRGKWVEWVKDSKQLTAAQRERVLPYILEHALGAAPGVATADEIDAIGIAPATRLAMMRALNSLAFMPQYLLLDAFPLPDAALPQKPIIHGDALCLSIAAASIVAKVARDRLMHEQHDIFPEYGFAQHKGYGTGDHLRHLERLGPCAIHRYSFAPIRTWGYQRTVIRVPSPSMVARPSMADGQPGKKGP